jgi:hypothetical protein
MERPEHCYLANNNNKKKQKKTRMGQHEMK